MSLTLEELKKTFSQEKLSKIDMKQVLQNFAEGKTYQELLDISDEVMQEFYHIASEYYDNHQFAEAADCFLFLIALNPLESNLWIRSGNAEQALRRFEEALEAYTMATMCNADDPFPHMYAAQVYIAIKEYDHARDLLNICLQLIGENPIFMPLKESVIQLQSTIKAR